MTHPSESSPPQPILEVRFFRTSAGREPGREPVREWLKARGREDRRAIGEDIKTAQFGWPVGLPLIRKLEKDLWEVRIHLGGGIARVMFTASGNQMILLHGFVKKSQKIPKTELDTARKRLRQLEDDSA